MDSFAQHTIIEMFLHLPYKKHIVGSEHDVAAQCCDSLIFTQNDDCRTTTLTPQQ